MSDDPLACSAEQIERSLQAIAPFYDLDFAPIEDDLELWRQLAGGFGRARILELGAGTGRLAVPLAADGHDVTAIDASPIMLQQGDEKMRQAGVHIIQADMRTPHAMSDKPDHFDLIICALGTFQHLLTRDDQLATLRNAAQRLKPDGCLALDLTAPRPEDFEPGPQPLRLEWTREHPCLGLVTKLAAQELAEPRCAEHPLDRAAPIAWITYIYESAARRALARFPLRVAITPGELDGLLRQAGLQPDHWYGSWTLDPLGHGDRTIALSSPAARQ